MVRPASFTKLREASRVSDSCAGGSGGTTDFQLTFDSAQFVSGMPGTGMFQSPIYQFWAGGYDGSGGDNAPFPEVLSSLSDATISNGDPVYRPDYQSTGNPALEYDGASDGDEDGHSVTADSNFPSSGGSISVFATFYATSADGGIFKFGSDPAVMSLISGEYGIENGGGNSVTVGTVATDTVTTMGVTYDDSTGNAEVFADNSDLIDGSTSLSFASDLEIGRRAGIRPYSGGLIDIVVCDTIETFSSYQSYHSDRTA